MIDMKEDELNPTILTIVLSEERGHVYQFQTTHDLAVFRSAWRLASCRFCADTATVHDIWYKLSDLCNSEQYHP